MKEFQKLQLNFIRYLRNPDTAMTKDAVTSRQQSIYCDLVYANINRIIAESFPITRSIISNTNWHLMISDFIANHSSQSPYFLEISKEFLAYLTHERIPQASDQPFMLELAHIEWINLALDIADIELPKQDELPATEYSLWSASPLVIGLTYQYPVHIIDSEYLPEKPDTPIYLLAYRNQDDDVEIQETDALTLRIVQLLQQQDTISCLELSQALSSEINEMPTEELMAKTLSILCELAEADIVFYSNQIKLAMRPVTPSRR